MGDAELVGEVEFPGRFAEGFAVGDEDGAGAEVGGGGAEVVVGGLAEDHLEVVQSGGISDGEDDVADFENRFAGGDCD